VAGTSAEGLSAMIEFVFGELQPDLRSVRFLYSECVKRFPPGELALLRTYWAEKAEAEASSLPPEKAAQVWLEAEQLYSGLDMTAEALKCGKMALECDPGDLGIHYHLALCLMKCEEFAEAETHLRWCLQRMPDNASVEVSLREALKRRLESQHRTATYGERGMSR
jgi:tetratricopeptide (TPR) repeat protein